MAGNFIDYTNLLLKKLMDHKDLAARLVRHNGERGRIFEGSVLSALRDLLPKRFQLGTGFIVNSQGRRSSQIDIVIYDTIDNMPVFLDSGVGVFPIESVYGTIEVKSILNKIAIEEFSESVSNIRQMAWDAKFYASHTRVRVKKSKHKIAGRVVRTSFRRSRLSPRAYMVAYDADTSSFNTLRTRMKAAANHYGSHAHGVLVLRKNWFCYQESFATTPRFHQQDGDAFVNFHLKLLKGIQTMGIRPVYLNGYFGDIPDEEP